MNAKNAYCHASLALALVVFAAPMRGQAQPVINVPPTNQTVRVGETAFFTVAATGATPVTYQWRKDGADIFGATGAILALGLARTDQAGSYTVVVRNASGSVTSASPAMLTVNAVSYGSVLAVGWSTSGQTAVPDAAQSGVTAIAAGSAHSVALKLDGSVVAWGLGNDGQTAAPGAARSGVAAIAAGDAHTVALKTDGSVVAWGRNYSGQSTVPIAARSGVMAVAAGDFHTVALKFDGSVVAWGDNGGGQTTVPVAAQSGVTAIAAGSAHSVALKLDGSVVAWGYNSQGQTSVPVAAQSGVVAIAAGTDHSAALKSDGSVVVWGSNSYGQKAVPKEAQSGVVAVDVGVFNIFALKSDGSIVAWGIINFFGETTVPVAARGKVAAISAGVYHTVSLVIPPPPVIVTQPLSQTANAGQSASFFVAATGSGWICQWRKDGVEIPGATDATYNVPFAGTNDAGRYTVIVSNGGGSVISDVATLTVRAFAPSIIAQPASQTVLVGDEIALSVVATGAPLPAYQWLFNGQPVAGATDSILPLGHAALGQSGNYTVVVGNYVGSVTSDVATLTVNFKVQFSASRYTALETGRTATITVGRGDDGPGAVTVNYTTSDDTATAGQDYTATSGTLTFGPGETEKSFTIPILDDALSERGEFLRVSLSGLTGPAGFGANTNAQVAIVDDELSPGLNTRARPVLAAGPRHTLALKSDGSLWAWGANWAGQLGLGMEYGSSTNLPGQVGADHDWATVAAGESHTLAVKQDGSLWAWGSNCRGQLGLGASCDQTTNAPTRVGMDNDWQRVAAGREHSIALKNNGSVWIWGADNGLNRPAQIGTKFDWFSIGAGGNRALGIQQDGTLWEMSAEDSFPVGADGDWEMVFTAGGSDAWSSTSDVVALKSDGTLWSWGWNHWGQLGDGTTQSHPDPAPIGTDNDWAAVAAAVHHTLGVKSDGSLWAWGANFSGQLGLGTLGTSESLYLTPARVGDQNDWQAISAGWDYSIGLKSDGTLWSWGDNSSGQLGLGREINEATDVPTRIGTDNDWAQPAPPLQGEFRITAHSINPDRSRTLSFTNPNSRAYYVLYRGESLTNINTPVDATLARAVSSLTDRTPPATNAVAFYRIRAVPRSQPLDLDQDGIDDYYELRHAAFLHPLNASDAAQDYDTDGYSNLAEYRAGTDPARLTVRHDIASGASHTVVLKQDGSLWAWGENTTGQLGDGTNERREQPVRVGGDTDWISVAAGHGDFGGEHTVALKRDGSLWAWGANVDGQLGVPNGDSWINMPTRVDDATNWTDVSAGGSFTAALKRDGSLWFWGRNDYGIVCCNGPQTPTRVGNPYNWVTLAAGGAHLLALGFDGSLWAWGNNNFGQCGFGPDDITPNRVGRDNDWLAIAASGGSQSSIGTHSLALKADGSLWSWGDNSWGQLGLGTNNPPASTPTRVGTDNDWTAIAAGNNHSLARKRDGSLWAWGYAVGSVPTVLGTNQAWRGLAAGGTFNEGFEPTATAIQADGSLWSWTFGVLRQPVPTMVGTNADWAAISAGSGHSVALKANGSLWAWGQNGVGNLGDGTLNNSYLPRPIQPNDHWRSVEAGGAHSMAIHDDGTLWTWGADDFGQLGNGVFTTDFPSGFNAPQPILPNARWKAIAAGDGHSAALQDDGTLWSWGYGYHGQLGNGVFTTNFPSGFNTPQPILPSARWKAVATGGSYTAALQTNGTLWTWGYGYSGQLGNGVFTTNFPYGVSSPQLIEPNARWKTVAAGGSHTVALRENGTLWAWGANDWGQLGSGTNTPASTPQGVQSSRTWRAVTAGGQHTVALRDDGTLWSWGLNSSGQLGDGTFNPAWTPHPIQPGLTWQAIAAGGNHTLALRDDGTLWAWGENYYGQLGILPDLTPTRLGLDTDWGVLP